MCVSSEEKFHALDEKDTCDNIYNSHKPNEPTWTLWKVCVIIYRDMDPNKSAYMQ